MATFLEIATPLAAMGIPITPVLPNSKRAFLPDFPTTATTDLRQLEEWNKLYPNYNAASVARAEKGGIWIWETDSPDVRERVLKETGHDIYKELNTFKVRSRQGRGHIYLLHNERSITLGNISQTYVVGQDWSARTNREYVVSPGSIHPDTGKPYEALNPGTPIVEAPDWLIDWLISQKIQKQTTTAGAGDAPRNDRGLVPKGSVHGYMLTQAGRLRQMGLEQDAIEIALLQLVHANCEPPIDEEKVVAMSKSVCSNYPAGQGTAGYNLKMGGQSQTAQPMTEEEMVEKLNQEFPAFDGQAELNIPMLVEGFMPEGVSFFGAYAGTIKTFVALSVVKALTTGEPLWGVFPVKEKVAVLYLTPEVSKAAFKPRLMKMGIVQDKELFRYRTLSEGATRLFDDPLVVEMVRRMGKDKKVLVVADTAIRFMQMKKGRDENNSMENSLQEDSQVLRALEKETGNSISFLFIHHSTKALNAAGEMTLENVLRGTGDFSAMADTVYGFRTDHKLRDGGAGPTEVDVVNLKPKDFEPPAPFRLGLYRAPGGGEGDRPISLIDTTGDMLYIDNQSSKAGKEKRFVDLIMGQPNISMRDVAEALRMRPEEVKPLGKKLGWKQETKGVWNPDGTPALSARGKQKTASIWVRILPLPNSPGMLGKVTEFLRITLPKKPEGWMFKELEPLCNQFDLSLGEPSLYPNVVVVEGVGKGGLWKWVETTEGEQQEGEAA